MTYQYKFVLRPKYVILDDVGAIKELFCKVCGTAIAGVQEMVRGRRQTRHGLWIEDHVHVWRRFPNYAELKMEFEDGSFHVTNGCNQCLTEGLTAEQLHELMHADMELEGTEGAEAAKERIALRSVAIRTDGGGIA